MFGQCAAVKEDSVREMGFCASRARVSDRYQKVLIVICASEEKAQARANVARTKLHSVLYYSISVADMNTEL